jgi:phosphoribosylformylglycinamidine cyclo-ligase
MGDVAEAEMLRTFNMGIGFVLVIPANESARAQEILQEQGHACAVIGTVIEGEGITFK